MNDFELGWVCGIIEGEGTFACYRYKHSRIRNGKRTTVNDCTVSIRVPQVDVSVLDKLKNMTGIGKIIPLKIYNKISKQQQHEWRLTNREDLRKFLEVIYPHMSSRRQEKIDALRKFLN